MALWLAFVAACLAVGALVPARTVTAAETAVGEAGRAAVMLRDAGLGAAATESILITGPSLEAARAAAADAAWRLGGLDEVAQVGVAVTADTNDAVVLPVVLSGDPETADLRLAPLQAAVAAVAADFPDLRVEQTGSVSLRAGLAAQSTEDLDVAALVSLPMTLIILLVVFGALVAAGVPVLLGLSAVAAAFGLSALVSQLIPSTGTTSAMVLLMGMAVGVDYSLFYVKRYRESLSQGHIPAVRIAVETSGHSVLISGIAVIIAMLGLFLVGDVTFSSLAACSALVVAVAMLGSLTVLPALLTALGRWMRPSSRISREPRLWPALLRPALRRPVWTLVGSVLAMTLLAVPALGMTPRNPDVDDLPRGIPAVAALHRLIAAFPDARSSHVVVVSLPAGSSASASTEVAARLRTLGDGTPRVSSDGRVHELVISSDVDSESAQARQEVLDLRRRLPEVLRGLDASWAVGGDAALSVDYADNLARALPWVVTFIVLATSAVIVVAFRSLVLALVTAVSNLISVGAAFGVITLVFQTVGGGHIVTFVPLFAFAVLSGLSMDYHVFVLTRVRELVSDGVPTREAVARGITGSAGTVTSAAVIMVSVFSVFVLGHGIEFTQLGVGLSTAVLIDALIIRAFVLPSLLTLLGRWTWWPARPQPSPPPAPSLVTAVS